MKNLIIIPIFICMLAFACSNSFKEENSNKEASPSDSLKSETTDSTYSKNLKLEQQIEEEKPEVSEMPTKIKKPVKPIIEETQERPENSSNSSKKTIPTKYDSIESEQNYENITTETVLEKTALRHEVFDDLLKKYVNSSGDVDYEGFKKNTSKLTGYLDMLKKDSPQSSWSKEKEMAYWINMYNAFTIYSILEKYPVSSIMDIEGGKIWDNKKIIVDGKSLTLNIIEKEKLLKRFKEPRVHFAVNCAAASCPPLLNKAWTEDNVLRYFSKRAKAFINNSKYNSLSEKSIEISQIFNWYAGDFGGSDKVLSYIKKYSETDISSSAKVKFKQYNWNLNNK